MENQKEKRARGSGSVYQNGSSVFWIKYYRRGIAFRESSKSTDRKQALRLLRRRLAEIECKTYVARTNVRVDELVADVVAEYRRKDRKTTKDMMERWEKHLKPFFERLPVDDLTTDLVQRYCERRKAEGAANGTINREVSILRHAFNLGLKMTPPKVRSIPNMPMHKEADPRQGFLADADYHRLSAECTRVGLWLRALFTTACSFAFRRGELVALRVGQVDLISNTIRLEVGETKNGSGRVIRLTDQVATLLTACCVEKKAADFVFTRDGKPIGDFRKTWANVCVAAGVGSLHCPVCDEKIEVEARSDRSYSHCGREWRRCDLRYRGLLVHDLRRTGVRNLRRLGIPESVAMRISGHKTRSTFERYNIVDETDLTIAASKLDAWQKSSESDFRHSLGIVAKNSTENEAAAHPNLTAVALPN